MRCFSHEVRSIGFRRRNICYRRNYAIVSIILSAVIVGLMISEMSEKPKKHEGEKQAQSFAR